VSSASFVNALWEEGGGQTLKADGAVCGGGGRLLLVNGTAMEAAYPDMNVSSAVVASCVKLVL
jgi:hypothetical protein